MDVRNIIVELKPYIPHAPIAVGDAHRRACSNDQVTMEKWTETWVSNIRENKKRYSSFAEHSVGSLFGTFSPRPCIIAGSGPSLKKSIGMLKDRPEDMHLVSCLHNFHYMEDHEANPDFYVSLDAGEVTIDEVSEGGKRDPEEYWEITKNRKLLCYIGTSPKLLEKWQGEVFFFNAPVPHDDFRSRVREIEDFNVWVESGGNVLGAATMIAKGFLGSQISIFIGSDFCFSNEEKRTFHSWDSKYDAEMGQCIRAVDIYGNSVTTWPSYLNFKLWFDCVAQRIPGIYINSSSQGCMGSYPEGNIQQIVQMPLKSAYEMFTVHHHKRKQAEDPSQPSDVVYI